LLVGSFRAAALTHVHGACQRSDPYEWAECRDHQRLDYTNQRKTAITSMKIGALRGHAEKTSTNARNRQINARKLHKPAEDRDH
jgi:hypothetical protein